jgi:hypothetical protein
MTDEQCPSCGSDPADRERYKAQNGNDDAIPMDLKKCPHCGNLKCCMCDMGDDVPCLGCDDGPDN